MRFEFRTNAREKCITWLGHSISLDSAPINELYVNDTEQTLRLIENRIVTLIRFIQWKFTESNEVSLASTGEPCFRFGVFGQQIQGNHNGFVSRIILRMVFDYKRHPNRTLFVYVYECILRGEFDNNKNDSTVFSSQVSK